MSNFINSIETVSPPLLIVLNMIVSTLLLTEEDQLLSACLTAIFSLTIGSLVEISH